MAAITLGACGNNNDDSSEQRPPDVMAGIQKISDKEIVATYDGGEVTGEEFKAYWGVTRLFLSPTFDQIAMMDPTLNETLLKRLIGFKIIEERADDETQKAELERAIKDLDELKYYLNQSDEQSFSVILEESQITEQQLLDYLAQSNIVHTVIANEVDDETLNKEYEQLKAEHRYDMADVRHILIRLQDDSGKDLRTKEEALELALEIKKKLDAGESMAELAEQYSEDGGSSQAGGLYENHSVNDWVPEFRQATIELPLNEVSEPVESAFGYHIIRVEERETLPLDQVKEDVRNIATQNGIAEFIEDEVPGLLKEIQLPQPEA